MLTYCWIQGCQFLWASAAFSHWITSWSQNGCQCNQATCFHSELQIRSYEPCCRKADSVDPDLHGSDP